MVEIRLRADKARRVTLLPTIKGSGQEARIDGIAEWTSSDPTVVEVIPDANGRSALIVGKGVVGSSVTIAAEVDADLGPGKRKLHWDATVVTVEPEADELGAVVGEEQDAPTPGPATT